MSRGARGRRRLRVVVRGAGRGAAARCDRSTRHVVDPPLTKIGVFTKDPRELVIARVGKRGRVTGGVRTLCASLSPTGRKRSRRCLSPRSSCFCTRSRRATRDPKRASPTISEMTVSAAGRRAPAVLGHRLLQGRDDGVGRRCQDRHRRRRSGDPSGRQRRPARDAEPALQRRVDGDGYRSCGAWPQRRPVSVELQGSAAVRPPEGAADRAAAWLEPGEQHPGHGRYAVPQARGGVEEGRRPPRLRRSLAGRVPLAPTPARDESDYNSIRACGQRPAARIRHLCMHCM